MTDFENIIDSFESSFQDKCVIPSELELVWLKKAVAEFSIEIDSISFDEEMRSFSRSLNQYEIDSIAQSMRVFYQERELSKVNKRISIVSKDLSIDGNGNTKSATKNELDYHSNKLQHMLDNQKPTAYV